METSTVLTKSGNKTKQESVLEDRTNLSGHNREHTKQDSTTRRGAFEEPCATDFYQTGSSS